MAGTSSNAIVLSPTADRLVHSALRTYGSPVSRLRPTSNWHSTVPSALRGPHHAASEGGACSASAATSVSRAKGPGRDLLTRTWSGRIPMNAANVPTASPSVRGAGPIWAQAGTDVTANSQITRDTMCRRVLHTAVSPPIRRPTGSHHRWWGTGRTSRRRPVRRSRRPCGPRRLTSSPLRARFVRRPERAARTGRRT